MEETQIWSSIFLEEMVEDLALTQVILYCKALQTSLRFQFHCENVINPHFGSEVFLEKMINIEL